MGNAGRRALPTRRRGAPRDRHAAFLLSRLLSVALPAAAWAACAAAEDPPPTYFETPQFALVDQMGAELRAEELRGTVWVAGFVFTNCDAVCPLITARMAALRDSLAAANLLGTEARLVSISVDPARDTPEVLRAYAKTFGASPPDHWAFLTGDSPDDVRWLVQEGFKVTAMLPPGVDARGTREEHAAYGTREEHVAHGERATADFESVSTGNYQVTHSPRLLLVDRDGWVRGIYTATEPDAVADVLEDLRTLR